MAEPLESEAGEQEILNDGFHVSSLDSGEVELIIVQNGRRIAAGVVDQKNISALVARFILKAYEAHQKGGGAPIPTNLNSVLGLTPTEISMVSAVEQPKNYLLVVKVGAVQLNFLVPKDHAAPLARYISSFNRDHSPEGSRALLLDVFVTFFTGLRGWGGVFNARFKAASRSRAISFWSIISGRSLRVFRTTKIAPGAVIPTYSVIGKCIYCDARVYSTKPGGRSHPFGGEHIVPEGLGGTIELPEASCQKCEETTGALVEGNVLGRTLKALRVHLKLKKKGTGPHPKTLPLDALIDGIQTKIDIPADDYPIVFMMITYPPPDVSEVNTGSGKIARGVTMTSLKYDEASLYRKYRISEFHSTIWDNQMFCRMLAKIGHALAVAELGADKFSPMLLDLIISGDIAALNLIGGAEDPNVEPKSDSLHDLSLGYQHINNKTYLIATVRLFARYGAPTYSVVVGVSTETPSARFKRVLSSRISRMLAR